MAYKIFREGFTLTEVLLAVAIVGIIAVLVLPATISKFHNELLAQHAKRESQAIKSALDQLVITENKANFGETMMYAGADADMDDTAGKFLKKYFRVAKYYGAAATNADAIKSECFADKYYEYSDNDKKVFDISDALIGACAKLKNGVSICIQPQIGQNNIQGIWDLNGPKGPNIKGRDYDTFSIEPVKFSSFDLLSKATSEVMNQANPNLAPDPENPCEVGDFSTPCCTYYMNKGAINNKDHECCTNPEIKPLVPVCASDINLKLNLYPTSACNLKDTSCQAWVAAGSNATQNGSSLSVLPATPPDVKLFCDGKYAGYLSGGQVKSHIENQVTTYFTLNHLYDVNVIYTSGEGISSTKCSVVFTESGDYKNYSYNGVNWTLSYY